MWTVVLRLGDLAQVAAPPWAAGQLGPGSGWRATQRRHSRKALERPQGVTPRGLLPEGAEPDSYRQEAWKPGRQQRGAGRGQRERLKNMPRPSQPPHPPCR